MSDEITTLERLEKIDLLGSHGDCRVTGALATKYPEIFDEIMNLLLNSESKK